MSEASSDENSEPLIVRDCGIELHPDAGRVITRLFVPGREDVGPGDSRAAGVTTRLMALDEDDVETAVSELKTRFADRHREFDRTVSTHSAVASATLAADAVLSPARRWLLGAAFTHEYAVEAAALCNPSIVVRPDAPADQPGEFLLSMRGIGEGHISSLSFRTGRVDAAGNVSVDDAARWAETGVTTPGRHHRRAFHVRLAERDDDYENAAYVLDALPEQFDSDELQERIRILAGEVSTRRNIATTTSHLMAMSASSYEVEFAPDTELSERVLWPATPAEHRGIEDARFVRFTDGDRCTYYATYTAFDGDNTSIQLLETTDFRRFASVPLVGSAARGKGMALFPRKIGGRYAALTRADRETNGLAYSDDLCCWTDWETIQEPVSSWEVLQLGNCGSPIETERGWLVLTHGVGAMRTYSLGAILLDLEEPHRVIARTAEPLLTPTAGRRDGYVPNVVYSCGALAHGDVLVVPYAVADRYIAIATVSISALLATMR
ncbi:MAG: glycoside hydrolase family 130 protein [Acidimicrobiia bacterium]